MPLSSGLSVRPGRLSSPLSGRRLDGAIAERPGGLFPAPAVAGRGSGCRCRAGKAKGRQCPWRAPGESKSRAPVACAGERVDAELPG